MDMETFSQRIRESSSGKALEELTKSEAGQNLSRIIDGKTLEKAAAEGDTKTMTEILRRVLQTPEGASFANQVKKTVQENGR